MQALTCAFEESDTPLLAGTSFPYIEFYPDPEKVRCVQTKARWSATSGALAKLRAKPGHIVRE